MRHEKPHVVYVFADQLRRQSCGYAGDKRARTPHMDRLREEGMSFEQAVVSMPVCCAYRASLLTGKYATSTGMVINELRINPDHHPRCLAHVLAEEDYELGYIGKWHLWANQLGHHDDAVNSFVPPGPHRLGFDGTWAAYNFHHEYYGDAAYYHTDSPEKVPYPAGVYEPDAQTEQAIAFINDQAKSDRPFALVLSCGTPHDPWTRENVPPEYYSQFENTSFAVPPNWRQDADTPYGDAWSDIEKSPEQLDEWMRVYYAMTANLDWNIGRLQGAIQDAGIEGDTLFVFTSDHGECFGAHGRMKKNIFYEEAIRVPLLIKWPGVVPAGHRSDACFNCVDIMPTLLGFVGAQIPKEVEGMDLSHCARGEPGPEPAFAFLQNTGACADWEDGHEWRAIRTPQYTFAVYRVDGKELLFDHRKDPYQLHNLADRPGSAGLISELRAAMQVRMTELNDDFEVSSYYRDHWISRDRCILQTARSGPA